MEVPTGGQIKVPTPCSSCRSGTAGPGGDGEGANHSSPPPGSSIEVCEGPHGHHFCLSTSRVIPRRRRACAAPPTRPSNGSWRSSKPASRGAAAPRAERARNYDAVAELVAERVEKSAGRMSAKRMLPIARAAGYEGSDATSADWSRRRKRCGAVRIIVVAARRCGRRVSIW